MIQSFEEIYNDHNKLKNENKMLKEQLQNAPKNEIDMNLQSEIENKIVEEMDKLYQKKIHEETIRLRDVTNQEMEMFYQKVQKDADVLIQRKEEELAANMTKKTEMEIREEIEREYNRKEKFFEVFWFH